MVISWYQRCVLDAVPEHAHEQVQSVEGQRRIYPRRGINRMITQRDEERDVSQDAKNDIQNLSSRTRQLDTHWTMKKHW